MGGYHMNNTALQTLTSSFYLYIVIGSIALLALGITFFLLTRKKEPQNKPLELSFLNDLYNALGAKSNIKAIELVQKRLQIEVDSVKKIDQDTLKILNMPAFVTGKKITLLIKDNTKEVYKYLNEKRKEEV